MMSRNKREGRYAGKWQGKYVRRSEMMHFGSFQFEAYKPFPDNGIAWMTVQSRLKKAQQK